MVGGTDRLVADWAGHFGRQSFPRGPLTYVLIPEILAQELTNRTRLSLTRHRGHEDLTAKICSARLRPGKDPAAFILHDNTKSLALLLASRLRIKEALETLLLALDSAEGLCATLGEFGSELLVVERGRAEVVAVHLGILNDLRVARKFVLDFRV